MDLRYWKQFENSGKIEDYLTFAACSRQEESRRTEQVKEDSHAGAYICDGNGSEGIPGGRI